MTEQYFKRVGDERKPVVALDDHDSGVIGAMITQEHYDSVAGAFKALGQVTKEGNPNFGREAQEAVKSCIKAHHSSSRPTGFSPTRQDTIVAKEAKENRIAKAHKGLEPFAAALDKVGLHVGYLQNSSYILHDHLNCGGQARKTEVTVSKLGFADHALLPESQRNFINTGRQRGL